MNLYTHYILPYIIDRAMKREEMEKDRPEVVSHASGVVLEIGFGSGLNLPYYKNVTTFYALDPSEELYEKAGSRIAEAPFPITHLKASAEAIPLPDNSVDSVVSTWSLCGIPNPEKTLTEIYRVLKPGGVFSFIEHGTSPKKLFSYLQNILTPCSVCLAGGCHLNRDIEKIIEVSSLKLQKLEKYELTHKPLAYIFKGVAIKEKKAFI